MIKLKIKSKIYRQKKKLKFTYSASHRINLTEIALLVKSVRLSYTENDSEFKRVHFNSFNLDLEINNNFEFRRMYPTGGL